MEDNEEVTSIVEFSTDISEAEQPEPLPAGEYPFTIREAEVKVSQAGKRYCAVSCYISPDDYPADYPAENAPDGKTLIFRRVGLEDTPQSRWGLRKFCQAIGAPMSNRLDVSEWVGLEGVANIEMDTYQGVTREQITRVEAA